MIIKSPRAYNTCCQFVFLILPNSKVLGVLFFQFGKHEIHRILKLLIIFPDFHGIDELNEGGEILFLHRGLIVDVPDEGCVQKGFCFHPEIVTGFAFTFGVGDENRHQLQNILFAVDIGERIVVHTFLEVDGVHDLQPVAEPQKHLAALSNDAALRKRFVKTECAFYLQTFYEQLTSCLDGGFIRTLRRCEYRF